MWRKKSAIYQESNSWCFFLLTCKEKIGKIKKINNYEFLLKVNVNCTEIASIVRFIKLWRLFFIRSINFITHLSQLVKPSINLMLIGLNWHDEYLGIPIQFKLTISKFSIPEVFWLAHNRSSSFLIQISNYLNILTEITKCKTIFWKVVLFWKLEIDIDG